jgi:hypothetical protein
VVSGATIQATPPDLQMILLPSGSVVASGQLIAKLSIASGDATHQSAGPAVTPIVLIVFLVIYRYKVQITKYKVQ